jgi:hypothetical protein
MAVIYKDAGQYSTILHVYMIEWALSRIH